MPNVKDDLTIAGIVKRLFDQNSLLRCPLDYSGQRAPVHRTWVTLNGAQPLYKEA
jgi:hypothetical protein